MIVEKSSKTVKINLNNNSKNIHSSYQSSDNLDRARLVKLSNLKL